MKDLYKKLRLELHRKIAYKEVDAFDLADELVTLKIEMDKLKKSLTKKD